MNETHVTIVGNLTKDPTPRETRAGETFATLRVATSERRRGPDGQYVDGAASYYSVTCFRHLARNVLASCRKGMPVVVHGRLRIEEWETTQPERKGTSAKIEAYSVGPDLARCHARVVNGVHVPDTGDRLADPEVVAATAELEGRVDLATGEVFDPEEELEGAWSAAPADQELATVG